MVLCVDMCASLCDVCWDNNTHEDEHIYMKTHADKRAKKHHQHLPHDQLHEVTLRQTTTHTKCWLCVLSLGCSVVFVRLCLLCVVLVLSCFNNDEGYIDM